MEIKNNIFIKDRTSADIAKERLLAVKAGEFTHMFEGIHCTEGEYEFLQTYYSSVKKLPDKNIIEMQLASFRTRAATKEPLQTEEDFRNSMEAEKQLEPQVANSVEATLAQRGSRYGDFTDHARLCQNLMGELQGFTKPIEGEQRSFIPWDELPAIHKQALTVIMDKIARILSGDPNYDDNWHDIQGYAKLVEDRLPCNQKKES